MVDLHSHVLFGIDDGAEDADMTFEILKKAEQIGIEKIIATPHFSIGDDVDRFIRKRNEKMSSVQDIIENEDIKIEIKAGAEVYITDELFNEDKLHLLTMGDSKVILCEFKYHGVEPETFLEYVDYIIEEGYIPLIAHVERYSFIRKNPNLVEAILSRRVLLQVNGISFFEDSPEGEFARDLYENKLVYAVGSDIHHVPSKRYKAMEKLGEIKNEYMKMLIDKNPLVIFENKEIEWRWME